MNFFSRNSPKTFNLLSIGQRGVGKTVFLAGSYAELQFNIQDEAQTQEFWFDCQDSQVQDNVEQLLGYVAQSGQYPPATMKITNFNFSLKRQNLWSEKTLCQFQWWDIPGEICNIRNHREFQRMVLMSHGCCVFIDAEALVRDRNYLKSFEEIVKQVMGIASLVNQRGLQYPLALIFTKCDLLQLGPLSQLQIEESLQPLITVLDSAKANYKRFYSAIPIVSTQGVSILKAKGAADPILWLTSELRKIHNWQWQSDLGTGLMHNTFDVSSKSRDTKVPPRKLSPVAYKYIFPWLLTSISLLGVSIAVFLTFSQSTLGPEQAFKKQFRLLPPAVERP